MSTPTTLWEYYTTGGGRLPSVKERSFIYEQFGLGSASSYIGTAEQNTLLLNQLLQQDPDPTPDESYEDLIATLAPYQELLQSLTVGDIVAALNSIDWATLGPELAQYGVTMADINAALAYFAAYSPAMTMYDVLMGQMEDSGYFYTPPPLEWSGSGQDVTSGIIKSPSFQYDDATQNWSLSNLTGVSAEDLDYVAGKGWDAFKEGVTDGFKEQILDYVKVKVGPAPVQLYETVERARGLSTALKTFVNDSVDLIRDAFTNFDNSEDFSRRHDEIVRKLKSDLLGVIGLPSSVVEGIEGARHFSERSDISFGLQFDSAPFFGNNHRNTMLGGTLADVFSGGDNDDQAFGFNGNDVLNGDAGQDSLSGGYGNDTLSGGIGNDTIVGGPGLDIARYSGLQSSYSVTRDGVGNVIVTGPEGTDTLSGIDRLQFANALRNIGDPVTDANADGKLDLLWLRDGASGAQAYWLDLRSSANVLTGSATLGYSGWNLVDSSGDFNGDGRSDVLWKHQVLTGANSYWLDLKNGSGNVAGGGYLGYAGWTLVDAGGDFNGDGRSDLVWKNDSVNGANAYWLDLKDGSSNVAGGGYLGYAGWTLWDATGDFNGDGRTDLVWKQDGASGANSFWMDLKNGTDNVAGGGYFGYAGWQLIDAAADLNGDGKTDLLWRELGTSRYWVDLKSGVTNIGGGYLGYAGWALVDASGDMNGDGRTDLIWKNLSVSGANAYFVDLKDGVGNVAGGGYIGYAGYTLVDAADDFNGDGMSDLLWKEDATGSYWLDLKNGLANLPGGGPTGYAGWSPIDPEIMTATVDTSLI